MPATPLTPFAATTSGAAYSPVAVDNVNGNSFVNTGKEIINVTATSAASTVTVTVPAQKACSFGVSNAVHDYTMTLSATDNKMLGPFPPERFNDANGLCTVNFSGGGVTWANVKISVIKH